MYRQFRTELGFSESEKSVRSDEDESLSSEEDRAHLDSRMKGLQSHKSQRQMSIASLTMEGGTRFINTARSN